MDWIIKCSYPAGSHTVMWDGEKLRFKDRQAALDRAETLNATTRDSAERAGRHNEVKYIVVEEGI